MVPIQEIGWVQFQEISWSQSQEIQWSQSEEILHLAFIPNYGDRHRHHETISTAFVESTVNYVVSKRFVKKQQMRWTQRGAHLLLQTRVQVLNDELKTTFCRWFPGMKEEKQLHLKAAA